MCPQCFRAHLHAVVSIKLKQRQLCPCKIFLWLWRYYQLKVCSNGRGQQCLEFLTSVLSVEWTRMQQLPSMLGPAVHRGKDTTRKTLKTMCNPRAWPQQFNISWSSSFSGCQFVLFSVLRHSAVHSAIVFLPLVWLRSRREKCKNRSVFWVSAECEWKRYLPTVVSSNTFTVNYLFFSKAVLKKFNYIKICLYLKLKRLRRDRALYKLRKERIYNGWLR